MNAKGSVIVVLLVVVVVVGLVECHVKVPHWPDWTPHHICLDDSLSGKVRSLVMYPDAVTEVQNEAEFRIENGRKSSRWDFSPEKEGKQFLVRRDTKKKYWLDYGERKCLVKRDDEIPSYCLTRNATALYSFFLGNTKINLTVWEAHDDPSVVYRIWTTGADPYPVFSMTYYPDGRLKYTEYSGMKNYTATRQDLMIPHFCDGPEKELDAYYAQFESTEEEHMDKHKDKHNNNNKKHQQESEEEEEEKKVKEEEERETEMMSQERSFLRERGHGPKGSPLCPMSRSKGTAYAYFWDGSHTELAEMYLDLPSLRAFIDFNVTLVNPFPQHLKYQYFYRADLGYEFLYDMADESCEPRPLAPGVTVSFCQTRNALLNHTFQLGDTKELFAEYVPQEFANLRIVAPRHADPSLRLDYYPAYSYGFPSFNHAPYYTEYRNFKQWSHWDDRIFNLPAACERSIQQRKQHEENTDNTTNNNKHTKSSSGAPSFSKFLRLLGPFHP